MARRKLSYSRVLIGLFCLFGIAACSNDDSEGIVGSWIRPDDRDSRMTFYNDGRIIVQDDGNIGEGTHEVEGNLLRLSEGSVTVTCHFDIIFGDTLKLDCSGDVSTLVREK